jgi:hypothetical protein
LRGTRRISEAKPATGHEVLRARDIAAPWREGVNKSMSDQLVDGSNETPNAAAALPEHLRALLTIIRI